jgi:serine protease
MRVFFALVTLFAFFSVAAAEDFPIGQCCAGSGDAEYVPGEIVVKFKDGVTRQQAAIAQAELGTTLISYNESIGFRQLGIPADKTVEEMVELFSARPDVEYAEPNYIAHAFMTPNDPYYVYQWHMPLINMPAAWDQSTGSGVVVAVIDCGVAYENYGSYALAPDLAGTSFVPGYDYVNNDSHPNDDCAHGTHVAGTIAQTTNNSLGVTGVAFNCSIMPVKVLDASGNGTYTAIANGITYAANNGAHVLNLSLGGSSSSSTLQNAVIYAYNAGKTIVCAAGNAGTSTPQYPAAYTQCISVSAVRYNKTYTSYTSYGSTIDICAPGGDVTVDQNGDGYVDGVLQQTHNGTNYTSFSYYFYEGTSMACPHVAGVAALVIAKAGGSMSPSDVRAVLQNTAQDLGATGWDQYYGYGLVDANAALNAVSGNNPPVAAFSGTPTSGYAPLTVTFTDASTNNPTSWSWTFGDGGTSTAQNPSHTYTSAGTYTVTLTATNAYGSDSETKTGYIVVSTAPTYPPVANFSGTPTSGNIPLTVTFTDLSTYNPTSWSWNFGDGGTSTAQNPTHTYTSAGTYTVTLTATNAYGSDSEVKTGYITASETTEQCDDFNDGNYTGWGNATGTWSISSYRLRGNSTTTNAKITSPFGSFTTGTITCSVAMSTGRTQRNTRIIFAYVDANNYRFIQGDDVGNTWRIYERVNGTNTLRASWSRTISTNTWYAVTVTMAANNSVTLKVGTTTLGSYTFSSSKTGLVGVGYNNSNSYFDNFCVSTATGSADDWVEMSESSLPDAFKLEQNRPNPFNPNTTISYSLTNPGHVTLEIYNILGQQVKTLVDQTQAAGPHQVEWNSTDNDGHAVASGIYFYRLTVGDQTQSKKMLLMK